MWFNKTLDNFVTLNIKIKFTYFHRQLFLATSRTNIQRTVFGILYQELPATHTDLLHNISSLTYSSSLLEK